MNKHYALFQIAGVLALVQGIVLAISTGWVILPLAFIVPLIIAGTKYLKYSNMTVEELQEKQTELMIFGIFLLIFSFVSGIIGLITTHQVLNEGSVNSSNSQVKTNAKTANQVQNTQNVSSQETVVEKDKVVKTKEELKLEKIERLKSLKERNIIDEQEFEDLKNKILNVIT